MQKRPDIELRFRERPYLSPRWSPRKGLFGPDQERQLEALPIAKDGEHCDVVYRADFPHDFRRPAQGKALIFATAEYGVLMPRDVPSGVDPVAIAADAAVAVVTPAYWNVDAFIAAGFPLGRIYVVPLGVDTTVFRPRDDTREQMRARLGLKGTVFMNVGAMLENKGIDLLLSAFAKLAAERSDVQLLLKGTDNLYRAKDVVEKYLNLLPPNAGELLASRLIYLGETLSNEQMSVLYRAADCYVAPYRAEGFGMPVLEAAACGLPVIATRGGPTEDFLNEDCSRKIRSELRVYAPVNVEGVVVKGLEPELEHLVELMHGVADDEDWRMRAGAAAVKHVQSHFTWERVTDQLVEAFYRMHEGKGA